MIRTPYARMAVLVAFACAAVPASAGKGLGPYYAIKYLSHGTAEAGRSTDGRVALLEESIETINCGGCSTVLYAPGNVFHLRNLTREPICARFDFTKATDRYGVEHFGSGSVHYLKAGQTAAKVGGVFAVNGGETGSVNVGYDGSLHTWQPIGKKTCGSGPA